MKTIDKTDNNLSIYEKIRSYPGDPEELKHAVITNLKTNKRDHFHWIVLGILYYMEKDFPRATMCFENCIKLDKSVKDCFIYLAFCLRHQGKYYEFDDIIHNLHKL